MESFLLNIAVLLFVAVFVLLICAKVKVPTIIGLFITGVLAGPHCLKLISNPEEINMLADIGAILLLFIIGLEFSLDNVAKFKKIFFIGGFSQILVTLGVMFITMKLLGNPNNVSIFFGLIVSLSSTAIVFKILQEKALATSPIGNISTAILIFQDIMIVPIMFLIPLLSGNVAFAPKEIVLVILKVGIVIALIFFLSRLLVPRLLYQIAKSRSRDLFLLTIICICLVIAALTAKSGLSLAFGAFIAGLIISESEYGNYAISNIMPFKDLFSSFLFISIGMILNINIFVVHLTNIMIVTVIIIIIKAISTFIVIYFLKYPLRIGIIVAFAISQVGEFSFVLSKMGLDSHLIDENIYQYFISAAILTMALTPILFDLSFRFAEFLQSKVKNIHSIIPESVSTFKEHIIVIGYGLTGKFIVISAKNLKLPYAIIEMNPETVKKELKKGEPIFYGDATNIDTLNNVNIREAKLVIVAISDILATRNVTKTIRTMNKTVYLIVRTPFVSETSILKEYGANEIIPAEFETSIEILVRALTRFLIPANEINKIVETLRSNNYKMLRELDGTQLTFNELNINLPEIDIVSYKLTESWPHLNKTIGEINFRKLFSLTIIAIMRHEKQIINPSADEFLYKDDIIIVMGPKDKIKNFIKDS
jgi:CPA2 family monovalent cation:H+ antiporter-2